MAQHCVPSNSPSSAAVQLKLEDVPDARQQPCLCLAVLVQHQKCFSMRGNLRQLATCHPLVVNSPAKARYGYLVYRYTLLHISGIGIAAKQQIACAAEQTTIEPVSGQGRAGQGRAGQGRAGQVHAQKTLGKPRLIVV